MDNRNIDDILSLASSYEYKLQNYRFYNDQLYELNRLENQIRDRLGPFLEDEELLLTMIEKRWSIIKFIDNKDKNFLFKACLKNPGCGRVVWDLGLLLEIYKSKPEIIDYVPPITREEFEEYMANNKQNEEKIFYSLDGRSFASLEEAMMANQEILNQIEYSKPDGPKM